MKNKTFFILTGILILIVFATMLLIRSYNQSNKLKLIDQQELAEIAAQKALLGEAYTLYMNNNLNAAEKRISLMLRKAPRNLAALQLLGNIFFMQKKYENAEKTFRTVIKFDPKRAINYNNLGQALAMQGKYIEAIPELKKAASLAPDMPQPYLNLAELYIKMKHKKAAINSLKKAIAINKNKNSLSIDMNAFIELADDPEFQNIMSDNAQQEDTK